MPQGLSIRNLATHFNLSDAERQELLPSGKQARFNNRLGWSCTHFKKAGLFTYPYHLQIFRTSQIIPPRRYQSGSD
jgi:restriction system protein